MGLIQGGLCKLPKGILLKKYSQRLRGDGSLLKDSDGVFSLSQMKRLQKFG